ncbi:MAG: exopolysaccharide Pel transporter PelG [Chlamydiota bacterium]
MAGIGFVLNKLFRKNDLTGVLQAYFHAVLSTSGPWLFTVFALGTIYALTRGWAYFGFVDEFRVINLYNFCFSLVFSAPITVVGTRFLADRVFEQNLRPASGMFFGALFLVFTIVTPFVIPFYFLWTTLPTSLCLMACIEFYLVTALWVCTIFISTLKFFRAVSLIFLVGMLISIVMSLAFGYTHTTLGILFGFSIGLVFILGGLIGIFYQDYPKSFSKPFAFLSYFKKHWELALGGLFYGLGIWVDKWVMWFSPEAVWIPSGFLLYPYYDSAMFVAYMTVIPAMATFMLSQETSFYLMYVKFYRDIQEHANYTQIMENHKALQNSILNHGRKLIILQVCICTIAILMAPFLFKFIGMNFIQLGMFRYGVLGASFHVLALLTLIILSYFEDRRGVLYIQAYFFLSNGIFTYYFMNLGFAFYGYGYFLSALTTFMFTAIELHRYVRLLPYHTFITTNASVISRA